MPPKIHRSSPSAAVSASGWCVAAIAPRADGPVASKPGSPLPSSDAAETWRHET